MSNDESELIIEQIQIGPMENFTYIVGSRSSREVAIVDPAWDIDGLLDHISQRDYKLTAALATHYHPDHVGGGMGNQNITGVAELMSKNPVKVYASDIHSVDSGDTLQLGTVQVEFLHTPGHTPGSQCFRIKNTLVSGDTLFIDGCGRVDLPGSSSEDMYRSLQHIKTLPSDTLLLPGHNYSHIPNATLAETKERNAYLQIEDLESWLAVM